MTHIETRCIALSVMMTFACFGCKKHRPGDGSYPIEKRVVVSTIAGNGADASVNGAVLSASFHNPIDVAVTSDGIIYVVDFNGHRVRKIAGGQVSTLAGSDSTGIVDGDGVHARFEDLYRIAVDPAGNCYILDQVDPRIRKITPSGYVTTYAGTGVPGFHDGATLQAQFAINAEGITSDAAGNIYTGDTFNGRVRQINSSAQVSTTAGDGSEGYIDGLRENATFRYPGAVTCDRSGNLYIADEGNLRIRKISTDGIVTTLAGSGTKGTADGNGAAAQFDGMGDIVADSHGNIYLIDDDRIRKITPAGVVSTIAGSTPGYADGNGVDAKFKFPGGLGIDAQDNIYVADVNNNRIRKISFQ